ncbi:putative methylesterase 11, chloroplastic [Orobanche minor]
MHAWFGATADTRYSVIVPIISIQERIEGFIKTEFLKALGIPASGFLDIKLEDLETNHLVLVRGGGFGAWCWYKTIVLLEEGGYKVTSVDLTGVGIHSFDPNSITSLFQYVRPLSDLLEYLTDGRKVILAGHDFGGACISYTMEKFQKLFFLLRLC